MNAAEDRARPSTACLRQPVAKDYLTSSQLTVDEIAGSLGYAETTNFRRAFKKWTGHSPSSLRSRASKGG